jgi:hypothetical protein
MSGGWAQLSSLVGAGAPARTKSLPASFRPRIEALEDRLTPSVTIQFDFSLDRSGFFLGHPDRLLVLQQAADWLTRGLGNQLAPVQWGPFPLHDPNNPNSLVTVPGLTEGPDVITIFVGGHPGGDGGDGGGVSDAANRGKPATEFGPGAGFLSFDTSLNWFFGPRGSAVPATKVDFLTAAEHELGHVLGFGQAPSWYANVHNGLFTGAAAVAAFGKPVPVVQTTAQTAHWGNLGALDTMTERNLIGTRTEFTGLDFAALQDTGWHLAAGSLAIWIRHHLTPQQLSALKHAIIHL